MRHLFIVLLLGFLVNNSFAQPTERETVPTPDGFAKPRVGPPEKLLKDDIAKFVNDLYRGDHFLSPQNYVVVARVGYFNAVDWFVRWKAERERQKIVVENIAVDKLQGNSATVTLSYKMQGDNRAGVVNQQTLSETFELQYAMDRSYANDKVWQIVPSKEKPDDAVGFLSYIVYQLSQKEWVYTPAARAERSMTRLKALALGVAQIVQDYDEEIVFAPEHLQEALLPYVRDKQCFFHPETGVAYGFNGNLSGVSLAQIKEPTRTVLFYEGEDEQLKYRYNGKAAVSFLDGHVSLIGPEEAKDLIWKL